METPDSILAKFDELIADIAADSARDKRETRKAERDAELKAERDAELKAERAAELEAERKSGLDAARELEHETDVEPEPDVERESDVEPERDVEPASEQPRTSERTHTSGLPLKPSLPRKPVPQPKSEQPRKPLPQPKSELPSKPVQPRKPLRKSASSRESVLEVSGLTKQFGETTAVAGVNLTVEAGTIFGIVGPNGAGKTTTLSMITGLLRPDSGTVIVHGHDVWANPASAKRHMGVLPDRLRLFDRLTGSQLLYYAGVLRGLPQWAVRERMWQLATALGFEEALGRIVADYSAGMTKKITLAAALIHSPRLLVLDEPFESVDQVCGGGRHRGAFQSQHGFDSANV